MIITKIIILTLLLLILWLLKKTMLLFSIKTNSIAHLKQLQWIPRMRYVKVYWYYGPTRTGKSWKVISEMGCPLEQQGLACDLTGIYFKNSHNK
jgi:hypothetical protein